MDSRTSAKPPRERCDRDRPRWMTNGDDVARDMLDYEAGRWPVPLLDDAAIGELLRTSRRIAVVGASPKPGRPSYDVFAYLLDHGYDCVPIHPTAEEVLGVPAHPTLAAAVAASGPVDIVDVFRRPEDCPPHAAEAVAVGARCLWLQLGIVDWAAARIAHEGGLSVVMDHCTEIEHARLVRAGRSEARDGTDAV